MRGLGLARWIAWLLAVFAFAALLADSVGGAAPLTAALDQTGFTLGSRRFTLLALVQIVIGLLVLYAVVRLAIRLTGQSIRRSRGLDPTQQLLAQKLAGLAIIAAAFFVGIDLAGIDSPRCGFSGRSALRRLRPAKDVRQSDRRHHPSDGPFDQAGRRDLGGESFGRSTRSACARSPSHARRQGISDPNELLMTQEVVIGPIDPRRPDLIPVGIAMIATSRWRTGDDRGGQCQPAVLDSPQPNVWMTKFGESAIEHEIRVWIQDPGPASAASDPKS